MRARWAAVAAAALAGGYAVALRPRLLRWGATDDEVRRPFPGAGIVPGGTRLATMATTIDAPPAAVWPWLVQMGTGRAGWYSWDLIDNLGRPSADRIHPEWQRISVGDRVSAAPGGERWCEVVALEEERVLCLRMSADLRGRPFDPRTSRPRACVDLTWGFVLDALPGGGTRLVTGGHWLLRPHPLQPLAGALLLEPSHWVMQTRQLANLRRRATGGR